MHFLSIISIFKNEGHVMEEWIEHYLNEGVDHFFLIDNGSTDNSVEALKKYIERDQVTLVHDDSKWVQTELYNKYFLLKRNKSKWFLVCDLDEFVYARRRFKTIKSFLKWRMPWVAEVRIPWKVFGSSGLVKQPEKVVSSFTKRCEYIGSLNPGMNDTESSLCKYIVRGAKIVEFRIHSCITYKKYIIEDSRGVQSRKINDIEHGKISEQILRKSNLHLNHYAIQSWEWFEKVKCTRGDAHNMKTDKIRDRAYFDTYDQHANMVFDDELAKKSQSLKV